MGVAQSHRNKKAGTSTPAETLVEATVGLEPTTYCLGVHLEHDFKNRSTKVKVAFIRMVMRYYDLFIVQSSFPYFLPLTETERKWNYPNAGIDHCPLR